MFDQFQKFSRAMMGAILFLPVIGTALVVATLLGNWSSAGTILNDISSLLGGNIMATIWKLKSNFCSWINLWTCKRKENGSSFAISNGFYNVFRS